MEEGRARSRVEGEEKRGEVVWDDEGTVFGKNRAEVFHIGMSREKTR